MAQKSLTLVELPDGCDLGFYKDANGNCVKGTSGIANLSAAYLALPMGAPQPNANGEAANPVTNTTNQSAKTTVNISPNSSKGLVAGLVIVGVAIVITVVWYFFIKNK